MNPYTLVAGSILLLVGTIGETVSDYQLARFKRESKGGILKTGLWTYSRHPNLFFELVAWFGLSVLGMNNEAFDLFGLVAPFLLWCVMNFLTIPVTEKVMAKNRGEIFKVHQKNTNKFLPFPLGN